MSSVTFWRRFARQRLAVLGLGVISLILVFALVAPLIVPHAELDATVSSPFLFQTDLAPSFADFPYRLFGLTTLNDYHRSLLAEVLYGTRPMFVIGFGGALVTMVMGTALGAIGGYFGGWIDDLLAFVITVVLSLPYLPFVIALLVAASVVDGGAFSLMLIFSLVGWPVIARRVRADFLLLREQDYAEAARAVGIGDARIIFRHLLPNALGPILALTTLTVAQFMVAIATLDYIGLDVVGQVTWGSIIANGYYNGLLSGRWWLWFFPGLFLTLTIVALGYISEGVRAAFDVRESYL